MTDDTLPRPERIVIVGAGQAGGTVAQELRGGGYAGKIVLIGEEVHRPYERPPLSKSVLVGDALPDSTRIMSDETFNALDLDFRPGTSVEAIDREAREVVLADGARLGYDTLVLATGGRPRRLDIPGADLPGVFMLRTIEDSLAIGAAIREADRVVVVGGGWIGLEIAAAARKLDVTVTLIEMLDRLCRRASPPVLSAYLQDLHVRRGVDMRLGCGIDRIEAREGGVRAVLSIGEAIEADVIVVGIGLDANDELARDAGLECDRGVLVDPCGRTSDPAVFAIGDVAVFEHDRVGRPMRLESWANARLQAAAAAAAILGEDAVYADVPWFWSDQYDINVQLLGVLDEEAVPIVRGDPAEDHFSCFYLDEANCIRGAICVNAPIELKVAQRLARAGAAVDPVRLADPTFNLRTLLKS